MATYRLPILWNAIPQSGVYIDLVSNQITAAASPSVGNIIAYVMNDAGSDEGVYGCFLVPDNYVGSPVIAVRGILDGAPGANDVLGFGFRKRAVSDNGVADGTFDAAQTGSKTIGSSGSNYSDEDEFEITITLTAGDYTARQSVYYYCYLSASLTTYTGNALVTGIYFQYSDV